MAYPRVGSARHSPLRHCGARTASRRRTGASAAARRLRESGAGPVPPRGGLSRTLVGLLLDTWDEDDLPDLPRLPVDAAWSFVS